MNTHVKINIDKRRIKKDGSCPIIFRLTHNRKSTAISTGYSVEEKFWDDKKREVKNTYKGVSSVKRLNVLLGSRIAEMKGKIAKLEESKKLNQLSVQDLRDQLVGKRKKSSVFGFFEELIQRFTDAGRIGNANAYKNTFGVLKNYRNEKDLTFEQLNYRFLVRFETEYLKGGRSINGLYFNMRTLRSTFNKAIKEGIVDKEYYPFDDYKLKKEPTKKRALPLIDLQKIIKLELEEDDSLFNVRNLFLVSFYLRGMALIDISFLKKSNIVGDRIQYKRKKTAVQYDMKISPELNEIFNFYLKGKKKDDFIFPILKSENLQEQYLDLANARSKYNQGLQKLGTKCEIKEHLTFYVARHTFATLCNKKAIPLSAISQMLGHTSLKTTQVYLDSLSKDVLDGYQDEIMSVL